MKVFILIFAVSFNSVRQASASKMVPTSVKGSGNSDGGDADKGGNNDKGGNGGNDDKGGDKRYVINTLTPTLRPKLAPLTPRLFYSV